MRNVLVTGASGFIGRAVAAYLANVGVQVHGLDRQPQDVTGVATWWRGDIRDPMPLHAAVARCDGVIHLAGVLGTAELLDDIHRAIDINVVGSLNVALACLAYGRPLVQISPGNIGWPSVYPATRQCADTIVHALARDRHLRAMVVRAMHCYGPWQKHAPVRKLIPNLVRSALRNEPAWIYGTGYQLMDPVWVDDVAAVLWRALCVLHEASETSGFRVVEVGTGVGVTVRDVAYAVWHVVGHAEPKLQYLPMRPGEPAWSRVVADVSTLAPLGMAPATFLPLAEGLQRTVAWYRAHPQWLDLT